MLGVTKDLKNVLTVDNCINVANIIPLQTKTVRQVWNLQVR